MTNPEDPTYQYPQAYEYPQDYQPQTVVIPPNPGSPRKSRTGLIIAGVAILFVAIILGVGAVFLVHQKVTVSVEQQIVDWRAKAAPDFREVASTMYLIGKAADNGDFSGVTSACVILEHDLKKARTNLPSPDEELTRETTAALDDYNNAAITCQNMDTPADVNNVVQYMESGTVHIKAATVIMDKADAKVREGKS